MSIFRPFPQLEESRDYTPRSYAGVYTIREGTAQNVFAPISGRLSVLQSMPGTDKTSRVRAKVRITQQDLTIDLSSLIIPVPLPSTVIEGDLIGAVTDQLRMEVREKGKPLVFDAFLQRQGGYSDVPYTGPIDEMRNTAHTVPNKKQTGAKIWPLLLIAGGLFAFMKRKQ